MPAGERAWWSAMYRPGVCVSVRLDARTSSEWVHGNIPRRETASMQQYHGVLPESRVLVHVPRRGIQLFHTIDVLLRHNCVKLPRTRRVPPLGNRAPRMTVDNPEPELVSTDSDATTPSVNSWSSSPCSRCDADILPDDSDEPAAGGDSGPARRASPTYDRERGRNEATSGRRMSGARKAAGVRKPSRTHKTSGGTASGKRRRSRKESGGERSGGASGGRKVHGGRSSHHQTGGRKASGGGGFAAADGQAPDGNVSDLAPGSSKAPHGREARNNRDGDPA